MLAQSIQAELLAVGAYRVQRFDENGDDIIGWYSCCDQAEIVIPVLSEGFVRSLEVESQITYAKDCGKRIVPVMLDYQRFWGAMSLCGTANGSSQHVAVRNGQQTQRHCKTCVCETTK